MTEFSYKKEIKRDLLIYSRGNKQVELFLLSLTLEENEPYAVQIWRMIQRINYLRGEFINIFFRLAQNDLKRLSKICEYHVIQDIEQAICLNKIQGKIYLTNQMPSFNLLGSL